MKGGLEKSANKLALTRMRLKHTLLLLFLLLGCWFSGYTQVLIGNNTIDLSNPQEYEIGGITVTGSKNFDAEAVILFTGLTIGDRLTIPGERISGAIKNLWDQQLFSDIKFRVAEIRPGNVIFLNIDLAERTRLSKFRFTGIKKSNAEDIKDGLSLRLGAILTENLLQNTHNIVRKYYTDKGFRQCEVILEQKPDSLIPNSVMLNIIINKGKKVKISEIDIKGNSKITDKKVKRAMKDTKEKKFWRIFSASKFLDKKFEEDKDKIIAAYNAKGFRNARIVSDTVIYDPQSNTVAVTVEVLEGNKFYFRNIRWLGNAKYTSDFLTKRLGIKKGDVYNREVLDRRLNFSQNGDDVSSLYLDDGYLAFSATPVEVLVENDSIDFEIRIYEGKQYRINKVKLIGNTKTNDRVVMREIRSRPGDLFSRADLVRTQRELSQLGYFNPETLGINPVQNPQDGTVDIEYTVEEKPSDQIELSGGFGNGTVVGTLGLVFTNFSIRNFFKKGAWAPLPSGDGQRLSLRAQSNGTFFQAYNFSFVEPWLGGKKPNSFSVSLSHSVQTNGAQKYIDVDGERTLNPNRTFVKITGLNLGLGKQLRVPDDYFTLFQNASYQYYDLNNFGGIFSFSNGYSNNISYGLTLSRNSTSAPIFPRYGSALTFTLKATPPYSAFNNKDYSLLSDQEKFKFVEYHKWKFTSSWFTEIAKNLVLNTRLGFGFLGKYNADIGPSPFERFYLGGSALSGFALDGREIIGLRGYDDYSLSPNTGGLIISKYTMELRYLLSPNPSATIYVQSFLEAGNTYNTFESYSPFDVYRSGGVGVRIFLPMFGLLGLDYGVRFDDVPTNTGMPRGQLHFTIGTNLGEL